MSKSFDPYYTWLGIPPEEQPPNHYRLLGVRLLESSTEVIANAADRQMTYIRTFQSGKQGKYSQKILNEISAARVCLLNVDAKQAYDAELQAKQANKAKPKRKAVAEPKSKAPPPVPKPKKVSEPAGLSPPDAGPAAHRDSGEVPLAPPNSASEQTLPGPGRPNVKPSSRPARARKPKTPPPPDIPAGIPIDSPPPDQQERDIELAPLEPTSGPARSISPALELQGDNLFGDVQGDRPAPREKESRPPGKQVAARTSPGFDKLRLPQQSEPKGSHGRIVLMAVAGGVVAVMLLGLLVVGSVVAAVFFGESEPTIADSRVAIDPTVEVGADTDAAESDDSLDVDRPIVDTAKLPLNDNDDNTMGGRWIVTDPSNKEPMIDQPPVASPSLSQLDGGQIMRSIAKAVGVAIGSYEPPATPPIDATATNSASPKTASNPMPPATPDPADVSPPATLPETIGGRMRVPEGNELRDVLIYKQQFPTRYLSRTQSKYAADRLRRAALVESDRIKKYALLDEAYNRAVANDQYAVARAVVDALVGDFAIDNFERRRQLVLEFYDKAGKQSDFDALARDVLPIVDLAAEEQRWEDADELIKRAVSWLRKSNDKSLIKEANTKKVSIHRSLQAAQAAAGKGAAAVAP